MASLPEDLTFFQDVVAEVADADWLELAVLDGRLVVGAGRAENLPASPAVMAPHHQTKLLPAELTHRDPLVGDPDGGGVTQSLLRGSGEVASRVVGVGEEAGLLTVVFLYSAGDRLHPDVPLIHIPRKGFIIQGFIDKVGFNGFQFQFKSIKSDCLNNHLIPPPTQF